MKQLVLITILILLSTTVFCGNKIKEKDTYHDLSYSQQKRIDRLVEDSELIDLSSLIIYFADKYNNAPVGIKLKKHYYQEYLLHKIAYNKLSKQLKETKKAHKINIQSLKQNMKDEKEI